jgi:hypothetical protein
MRELSNNIYQSTMDKGKIDKNTPVHVFESKPLRRDFGFKISAADVFNDFLYVGDDKGTPIPTQATSTTSLSRSTIHKSFLRALRNRPRTSPNTALTNYSAIRPFHRSSPWLTRNCT